MRMPSPLLFAIATIAAAAAPAAAQEKVSLTVDQAKTGPRIEREVYGQFAEHLGRGIYEGVWVGPDSKIPNTDGYRNDVLAALKHLQVPVIRWPGGCYADIYDWRDGIGPRDKRPERINYYWGGVIEPNAFGTHEFMNLTEALGAEAYVAGNMGSMPALEMGRWLEYITADKGSLAAQRAANGREKPWPVRYWGVGNETWGCGGEMEPEYSANVHRRYKTFVKAAPGTTPPVLVASGSNGDDIHFTEVMTRDAGKQMDALSIHYYTITGTWAKKGFATGFTEGEWAKTLAHAIHIDDILTRHSAMMDKFDPDKRIGLYVDEWGTWYDQEPGSTPGFLYQQNSLRDAEVAALTLNIFHRHTDRVKLAAIAQMVNVLQAMILTDGPRMVLTPTYHVFDMYRPFQRATPYAASVKGPRYDSAGEALPMVDASAARGADGKLWLSLTNLDPNRAARVETNLTGRATGRILTGPAMDTHNSFDRPNTIQPAPFAAGKAGQKLVIDLPAKSVLVVMVE